MLLELDALVEEHPLRERLQGQRILALYRSGRQAEALATYHQARRALVDQIGVEPGLELRRLHDAVLRQDRSLELDSARARDDRRPRAEPLTLPTPLRRQRPFVGRTEEIAALLRAVRPDEDGRARVVLLSGEAGIGKTSLAARAAREAEAVSVLYGRCDEEPLAPFQPFTEALGDLLVRAPELRDDPAVAHRLADLAPILPALGDATEATGETDRHRLFEAAAALMEAVGTPLLFVIDDLHWADAPTLTMLRSLVRRTHVPVVILATTRDTADAGGPLADLAVDLRREARLEPIHVGGLDVAATGQLIAARTEATPPRELVLRTHARSGGNPFFIEELLHAEPDQRVPEGVKALIAQRVARLTVSAAAALRLAATIGAEFEVGLLVRLVGDREEAVAALDAALGAGLIAEAPGVPGRLMFVHALVREAVYEGISAARRASAHLRVGEALESLDDPLAAAVAHHYLQARHLAGPEKAIEWAVTAAEGAGDALGVGARGRALRDRTPSARRGALQRRREALPDPAPAGRPPDAARTRVQDRLRSCGRDRQAPRMDR